MNNKKELLTVPYMKMFECRYVIEEKINLLTNSIEVYECNDDGTVGRPVNFDIICLGKEKIIAPFSNEKRFLLRSERLFKGYILKIKPDDYAFCWEDNGDYEFAMHSE